jgi:hypothetical protein
VVDLQSDQRALGDREFAVVDEPAGVRWTNRGCSLSQLPAVAVTAVASPWGQSRTASKIPVHDVRPDSIATGAAIAFA